MMTQWYELAGHGSLLRIAETTIMPVEETVGDGNTKYRHGATWREKSRLTISVIFEKQRELFDWSCFGSCSFNRIINTLLPRQLLMASIKPHQPRGDSHKAIEPRPIHNSCPISSPNATLRSSNPNQKKITTKRQAKFYRLTQTNPQKSEHVISPVLKNAHTEWYLKPSSRPKNSMRSTQNNLPSGKVQKPLQKS